MLGDCNDANVIVSGVPGVGSGSRVSGLIDVGDATHTWTVNDVAIAMAYSVLSSYGQQHPKEALVAVATGYCAQYPLSDIEAAALPGLVRCRLATSIACGAFALSKDPDNEYLKIHAVPARSVYYFPPPQFTIL